MKIKKQKAFIWALLVVMIAMYGFLPLAPSANAVNAIIHARDTLSDSQPGESSTHTIAYTTSTTTDPTGYVEYTFPAGFSGIAVGNVTCPNVNWTRSVPSGQVVRCTANNPRVASNATTTITGIMNPPAGSEGTYVINIKNYGPVASGTPLLEQVQVMVSIHKNVWMTATVNATLKFTVSGRSTGDTINGVACDNNSTATTTPFGTLLVGIASTVCQRLNVGTNANEGYIVTVEQDAELLSDSGANINSFDNAATGAGSTTPHAWASPLNVLDQRQTYGHMGFTSNDIDVADNALMPNSYFPAGTALFVGFVATAPVVVMAHTGPADGDIANVGTQNIGQADILYRAQIASLQEAGDYDNTLTYICTPTY